LIFRAYDESHGDVAVRVVDAFPRVADCGLQGLARLPEEGFWWGEVGEDFLGGRWAGDLGEVFAVLAKDDER
jgi:hypothetical protein